MPTKSPFPNIQIPDTDIWSFLFERPDRPYPDDKGTIQPHPFADLARRSIVPTCTHISPFV